GRQREPLRLELRPLVRDGELPGRGLVLLGRGPPGDRPAGAAATRVEDAAGHGLLQSVPVEHVDVRVANLVAAPTERAHHVPADEAEPASGDINEHGSRPYPWDGRYLVPSRLRHGRHRSATSRVTIP